MKPGQVFNPKNHNQDDETLESKPILQVDPAPTAEPKGKEIDQANQLSAVNYDKPVGEQILDQNRKFSKKKIIAASVILLIILILGLSFAGWFYLDNKNKDINKTENGASNNASVTNTQVGKSLISYLPDASTIKNGTFQLTGEYVEKSTFAPNFTGKFSLNNGEHYTIADIDEQVVKKYLDEVKNNFNSIQKEVGEKQVDLDFYYGKGYQIDLLGLLKSLGVVADVNLIKPYMTSEEDPEFTKKSQNCNKEFDEYDKKASNYINNLSPNYAVEAGVQNWSVPLDTIGKDLDIKSAGLSKNCADIANVLNGTQSNGEIATKSSLVLSVSKSASNLTVEGIYDAGIYMSPRPEKLFSLVLSDINKTNDEIATEHMVSAFTKKSIYTLKVNECKAIPIIATNFAAANSYTEPSSKFYMGPSFVDSAYFCTAQEAQEQGYDESPLGANLQ